MTYGMRMWAPPLAGTIIYPGLIFSAEWALEDYHQSGNSLLAAYVLLAMLLALSVPALALRALLISRDDDKSVHARGILYLLFAVPSLFTLTYSTTRMVGVHQHLSAIWILIWIAIGMIFYHREKQNIPLVPRQPDVRWLRTIHGVTALLVLCGFLLAHLINHDLAAWSVNLHINAMKALRLWYRSEWVEPVLIVLVVVLLGTGVPMVVHYARRRMDAFRVIQTATGMYVAAFLCSHVFATLRARSGGTETDWFFAAGPLSLLQEGGLRDRLIPHYFIGPLALIVHVACGLRIVLLQHGLSNLVGKRLLYALAAAGLLVTVISTAALLGFHVRGS
jgi:hypothetical protein